jgi:hypothetical protein
MIPIEALAQNRQNQGPNDKRAVCDFALRRGTRLVDWPSAGTTRQVNQPEKNFEVGSTMHEQKPKAFSRWFPLVALYVAQFALGSMSCFTLNGGVYWICSLMMASMAAMWVVYDAQHRGKPLLSIVQLIVMGLWPIAVPIYLITTRGMSGLVWAIVNLVGLMVAAFAGYHLTVLAFWGPDAIWSSG